MSLSLRNEPYLPVFIIAKRYYDMNIKIIRILLVGVSVLISSSCMKSQEKAEFELARLNALDSGVADQVYSFFTAIENQNYVALYEFGSDEFKRNFPKDWFLQAIENWSVEKLDVLSINESHGLGFYLIISYKESNTDISNELLEVFFWKIDDGKMADGVSPSF